MYQLHFNRRLLFSCLVAMAGATIAFAQSAPTITAISAPQQVVGVGQSLTLSVTVTSASALTYQWMNGGLPIPGATSANYVIGSVLPTDSGWYRVVVSNASGSVTSAVVFVLVDVNPAQIVAWGSNAYGASIIPSGLTDIVAISAFNDSSLAVLGNGTVIGWGDYYRGQTAVPSGLTNVVSAEIGYDFAIALKSDGTVTGWGHGTAASVPAGLASVVGIACGAQHALALKSDGTVVAWGDNTYGEASVPSGLGNVIQVTAGYYYSLALESNGTVVAWGSADGGVVVEAPTISNVTAISAGYVFALALRPDGTIVGWGDDDSGELDVPSGLGSVIGLVTAGQPQRDHSLALKADGTVVAWGSNLSGESYVPPGLDNVVQIAGGNQFSMALRLNSPGVAPTISQQPSNVSAVEGQGATFGVLATGFPAPTFQWQLNGSNISGATGPTLAIASVQPSNAGAYAVVVTNGAGSVVSTPATLSVGIAPPIITTQPIGATIVFGASTTLSVVASSEPAPTYQWQIDGVSVAGATSSSYVTLMPGSYTVVVANSAGSVTSNAAVVSAATRLVNISNRALIGNGADVEIAGFVVSGPPGSTEQVLIRGVGPALSQFGVSNILTTPVLTLFDSAGNVLATNTGWSTSANAPQIASAAATAGAFPLRSGSADSALLASLAPGSYTAEVSGLNGATGVALAEVYEMSAGSPELVNISARAFVSTGSSVEIAGIVISGSQPAKVLVRAVGPTLSQFGVAGVLAQPSLSLVNSSGVTVASNTGWLNNPQAATVVSEAAAVGAFALRTTDADSALFVALPPGTYTAVVSGVGGTTGVALVEVYRAP
jgi:hypothetical protein